MPILKDYNVPKDGCAHTPFREKSVFGRFYQYLWHRRDYTVEVPRCIYCGAPLQSPVEHYFILLSAVCFILSAVITWLVCAYIVGIAVRLLPIKLLLAILLAAMLHTLQFLLIRIVSACLCAGAGWREIVLMSDNEDALRAMSYKKGKVLRNGLQLACSRGMSLILWLSVQLPVGYFVLIGAGVTLVKRLFARDYRFLWIWIAAIAYSALAIAVELFWGKTFVAISLNCISVLVIAIVTMLDNHLDVN